MTKTNAIQITADYRMVKSDERNITLEERYMSAPPVIKPADYVHVPQERWRSIGDYGQNSRGLATLLEAVAYKTALAAEPTDLAELAAEIRRISADLAARVSGLTAEVGV